MQIDEPLDPKYDKKNIDAAIIKLKEILESFDENYDTNLLKPEIYDNNMIKKITNDNILHNDKIKIYKKNLEKYCEYLGWYELDNSLNTAKYKKYKDILRQIQKNWIIQHGTANGLENDPEYKKIKIKMASLYEKINTHNQTKNNMYDNIKKIKSEIKNLQNQ